MKIKALGAVRTVTGSCFRIEMDNGHKVLLDCGLFQGGRQTELRNANSAVYDPLNLSAVVITHAHIDHSGLVPKLVKDGYAGPIYATAPTCELLEILWVDAANIQEQEAQWKSRKNGRQGKSKIEPLYTEDDARQAMRLLKPINFEEELEIVPGLTLNFFPAGHILGASSVSVTVREDGHSHRLLFSGDIGRSEQILMPPPAPLPPADTVFMETTYGNRDHKDTGPSRAELIEIINTAAKERGKILIPAFAVERTQEILILLAQALSNGEIPNDLPIILDSPLATAASEIYVRYINLFDKKSQTFLAEGYSTQQTLPTLRITRDASESQKINDIDGPAIIVAGSGMANAGRILHHLKHNLWRPECHVVFVGFQAQGTTGRRLVEGVEEVKIFREQIKVKAKIHTIGGFSGHADRRELLAWLSRMYEMNKKLTVNLIHGEESSTLAFQREAEKLFPGANFNVPHWLQFVELGPDNGEESAGLQLDARNRTVADSFRRRLDRLKDMAEAAASLPPDKVALAEKYFADIEDIMALPKAGDD